MSVELSKAILKKYNIQYHYDYYGVILFRNFEKKSGVLKVENDIFGFKNYSIIIEPIYTDINCWTINDQIVFNVRREDNLCGLLSIENDIILDFEYIRIYAFTQDQKSQIRNTKNELFSFDFNSGKIEKLPFDQILFTQSNTYGAPTGKNCHYHKSLINSIETKMDFYDTDLAEYIGKWGIVDSSFNSIISNKYDYIDFLRNQNHFKIAIGNPEFENEGEHLVLKNMKWGIIDENEKTILPTNFDWVDEINTNLYAVNIGGELYFDDEYQVDMWSIKGGKWGVYNSDNKLIVPIEYDKIFLNFYQVKGYIFVKNEGNDYDVFTFNGDKIDQNKPNHMDYI
ncbi:WG repeat-containing protein [Flavobacterium sp. j3]|uniref:WG repeat-containing protein n=1 Tax=Flavobacterium aureirubrum TaxID=3133147 RepID=A0ABU9NAV0_9FLAO